MQGKEAKIEDGRDHSENADSDGKIGEELVIGQLFVRKKAPEVLDQEESTEEAGVDADVLDAKMEKEEMGESNFINVIFTLTKIQQP